MTHVRISGVASKLGYRPGPIPDVDPMTLSCMPTSGLVHQVLWWSRSITDTPPWYHLGAILPILAHEMSRLGWVIDRNLRIQPRLWTLLVGTSGIGKTTLIRRFRDFHEEMLRRFDPELQAPWIFCDGTQRGLFMALAEHYNKDLDQTLGILTHDEFSVLLSDRRHQIDVQELCRWKDGGSFERHLAGDKKAKKDGQQVIDHLKNVSLNGVFATTSTSIVKHSTSEHFEAGMYSRMNVMHRPVDPRMLRMNPGPALEAREVPLVEAVNLLRHWTQPRDLAVEPVIEVSKAIEDYLEDTLMAEMRAHWEEDGRLNASRRRSIETAKIVAGIYCWSDWCRDGQPALTAPHMTLKDIELGVNFARATIDDLERLAGGIEMDPEMRATDRIFDVIKRAGSAGCGRRDIMRKVGVSKFMLDRAIATLEAREAIEVRVCGSSKPGRPGQRFFVEPEFLRAHLHLLHGGRSEASEAADDAENELETDTVENDTAGPKSDVAALVLDDDPW